MAATVLPAISVAVRIYRRPLTGTEIAALAKGQVVDGALLSQTPAPDAPPQLVARRVENFLEYPPSADIDFQENFTLAAEIRPVALAGNARSSIARLWGRWMAICWIICKTARYSGC